MTLLLMDVKKYYMPRALLSACMETVLKGDKVARRAHPRLPRRRRHGIRDMIPVLVAALAASAVLLLSDVYGTSAAVNATSNSNVNPTFNSSQIDADELQLLRDRRPDYSGPAELALSISWPLHEDGKKANPMSYTGIRGEDGGTSAVLPSCAEARQRAASRQEWPGKKSGILPEDRVFGSCSNFVSTVVINTVTPAFPKFTGEMYDWVTNPDNGWQLVGTSKTYDPSSYRPGDVFLTEARDTHSCGSESTGGTRMSLRRPRIPVMKRHEQEPS